MQLSETGLLSVSLKMYKFQYLAVIKLFVKEGLTPNKTHSKFIKVYGDCSASFSTIKKWAAEFKRGRTSLEDDPLEGRPKSATTPDIIEQVHDMVLDDRRMKVREIAETIGISKERVGYILHETTLSYTEDILSPCIICLCVCVIELTALRFIWLPVYRFISLPGLL
jgi:transposase